MSKVKIPLPPPLNPHPAILSGGRGADDTEARGATVAERLAFSLLNKVIRVQSPAGPLADFRMWGIVPDDTVGRWVFSGVSRFPRPFIPEPLHAHLNNPHRLTTSMLRSFIVVLATSTTDFTVTDTVFLQMSQRRVWVPRRKHSSDSVKSTKEDQAGQPLMTRNPAARASKMASLTSKMLEHRSPISAWRPTCHHEAQPIGNCFVVRISQSHIRKLGGSPPQMSAHDSQAQPGRRQLVLETTWLCRNCYRTCCNTVTENDISRKNLGPWWLSSWPARLPPRRSGFNPRPGHPGFSACGNRAGRCRWSVGFLGDLPFPPTLHPGAVPYSPQSPSSAFKTLMLRAVQISSLTRKNLGLASPRCSATVIAPPPSHHPAGSRQLNNHGPCNAASRAIGNPFGFELRARTMPILHEAYFTTVTRKLSFLRELSKTPVYLQLFSAFEAERRGSVKGDTATRIKSPIATKCKTLNWCAVCSSCCVYLWDFPAG
ncbi:hypothetical protein PR048_017631 [Dryococelus australis]|uniref:Uncharacterized protein n=1 Tax=Dryococelus australis TaxID=614101 RepID=A0ABQ9HA13_9NEOP|nr:hypothetical protein PR048_017631 [Dryococelus australis]